MEVGCRTGAIVGLARGKCIAVAPFFQVSQNVIGPKPELHIFQQTSDEFFDSGFLKAMKIKFSFSFLDGMHLFEFLLRDFIAAANASDPNGVIAMHDCCPFSHEMTTRGIDNLPDGAWTGDVWKLIPTLREFRPDLEIKVLDAAPTGLVLVSGLKPKSKVLKAAYNDIVARYKSETLKSFGISRFNNLFEYTDARAFANEGYVLFEDILSPDNLILAPKKITP